MCNLGIIVCTVHLISGSDQQGKKMYHYMRQAKRLLAWYIYCAKKHFISLSTLSNFFEKNTQKKLSMICWVFANLSQNLFHLTKLWVYQIKPIKLAFSGLKWMFFCFKTIILKTCFLNPLQTSDFDYWNKEQ